MVYDVEQDLGPDRCPECGERDMRTSRVRLPGDAHRVTRHRCDCGHRSPGWDRAESAHRRCDAAWLAYERVLRLRLEGMVDDAGAFADLVAYHIRARGFERGVDEALGHPDPLLLCERDDVVRVLDDVRQPSRRVEAYA